MPSLAESLAPLVETFATRATTMANSDDITPAQLSQLMSETAALARAMRPIVVSTVAFNGGGNAVRLYATVKAEGTPFLLVVNGVVISRDKWAYDESAQVLSLIGTYRIPTGNKAELYYTPPLI